MISAGGQRARDRSGADAPACVVTDFGSTISAGRIDHLIGQKPVDPEAAAALRILHDDHGMRLVLASNTLPCETRWPALQQAGIDDLFSVALLSYPLGVGILRTNKAGVRASAFLDYWEMSLACTALIWVSFQSHDVAFAVSRGCEVEGSDDLVRLAAELGAMIKPYLLSRGQLKNVYHPVDLYDQQCPDPNAMGLGWAARGWFLSLVTLGDICWPWLFWSGFLWGG